MAWQSAMWKIFLLPNYVINDKSTVEKLPIATCLPCMETATSFFTIFFFACEMPAAGNSSQENIENDGGTKNRISY